MITFKKLTWKNFLSTGNNETTIYLDQDSSTLVVGANGAGKSTMLDALSYGLFGKPHRSINKPQLVNSINNKNCLVTVDFSVGNIEYKIIRGMKPNIFEVYRNGKLLDQESHSRDYQKIIEQNILKLNHKSFHQVVVLGSSNFIPFMQLPSHQRRNVIEDLLDIGIFTKMNGVLKDKVSLLRSQMTDTDHQLELLKETIRLQNNHIADLKRIDTTQESKRKKEIKRIEDEILEISNSNITLQEEYDNTYEGVKSKMDNAHNEIQNHNFAEQSLDTDVGKIVKEAKFYEVNNVCPTCSQDISLNLKNEKIAEAKVNAKKIQAQIDKSIKERREVETLHDEYRKQWVHLNEVQSSINTNNVKVSVLKDKIKSLEKVVEVQDTTLAEEKLEKDRTTREELNIKRSEQSKVSSYLDAISELLRDTGIKTKVIRQYLPVMNKLINQYLQILDFFVLFHLDDSFNETIKSRHRDEFTYASFSEGEKQRIDLSLLFAWRQIARMKNSANTNLLILDETFDSSMDADGVDNLLKILYTLGKETNVFIISHKQDLLEGKFPKKLEFEKTNNFSRLKKDGAL
jgi:DNA repair exonuclease SbcCD ATPase subunit